jgi:hypothetical protein
MHAQRPLRPRQIKLLAEKNQIMLADLSILELEQNAWFEKQALIRECDA